MKSSNFVVVVGKECARDAIQQMMKLRTLTLWDQFTNHEGKAMADLVGLFPVILGTRMKVNTSNGIKLGTRGSSTFCFNPPLPEANALHIWCMGNSSAINKLRIHDMNGQGTPLRCLTSRGEDIIKINQLPTIVSKIQRRTYRQHRLYCRYTICPCRREHVQNHSSIPKG